MAKSPLVPAIAADLTPEWLTSTLRASGAPSMADILQVSTERLGGAESLASEVVKLSLTYSSEGEPGPAELVARLPSTHEGERRNLFARGSYRREADFYREFAASAGVPAPGCYYAAHDEGDHGFCLLLDSLRDGVVGDSAAGATAEQVARMHARFWSSSAFVREWMVSFVGSPISLNRLAGAVPVFLERYGELVPPRLMKAVTTIAEWMPLRSAELANSPVTFLHGDASAKNLFFPDDSSASAVAFDWALTGYGAAARDLVVLIVGRMNPEPRAAAERNVLAQYHETLRASGVTDYSLDDCWRDYRLGTLLRIAAPVVNAAGASEKRVEWAGVLARRTLAAAEDLEVTDFL